MNLENNIWSTLEGGYKITYDASTPLKKLQSTNDKTEVDNVFAELWENLHHQGDVGLASYLSVPHIVSTCIDKKSFDWNYIGLTLVIEHCRLSEHNPVLPTEYSKEYFNALISLEQYLLANFKSITDPDSIRFSLALFATLNGQAKLGKAIENLDDDVLNEFLEQY
jgi:hypothetical protein